MPTKVIKILDKGTKNHIVARTSVQISGMLAPYPLSNDERQSILATFESLMRRLLRMHELEESQRRDYDKIRLQVREAGLK